jgi:hypothetical protein
MGITPDMREKLYERANGCCECEMKRCPQHTGRCGAMLRGPWGAHRKSAGRSYRLGNLTAMCQTCHRNTPTYGRG